MLSVRPEALRITARDAVCAGGNTILGRVVASAYQGSHVEYEITALDKLLKAYAANARGTPLYQAGDEVALSFAPDDVMVVPERPEP
jgi:hypothetical protein